MRFLRCCLPVLVLLGGCTTLTIDLPSITESPTSQRSAGKIIWHDLLTTDIDASKAFYQGLFGWTFEEIPLSLGVGRSSKYLLIRHDGRLIGGMVDTRNAGKKANNSQWVSIMSVADIEAAAAAVKAAGGQVLTPPTDLAERGSIAIVTDATGALFAMLETRYGDPLDQDARAGEFIWDEVWTDDIDKAVAFYQALAPFETTSRDLGQRRYQALSVAGSPSFGLIQDPIEGLAPTWAPYIKVDDMSILTRVAELGGEVALPAEPRDLGGEVALILGPTGAGVVLQTWPDEEG